jgi:hypothetical protein
MKVSAKNGKQSLHPNFGVCHGGGGPLSRPGRRCARASGPIAHGRLILTVLGWVAESERALVRPRTGGGCARALARGVRMGRKPNLRHHPPREATQRLNQGVPPREIARTHNFHHGAIAHFGV